MTSLIQRVGHFDVDRNRTLGKGGNGHVFLGTNIQTGQLVAAKEVYIGDPDELEQVQHEVDLHGTLEPHENIVLFHGSETCKDFLWILTAYCEHGDLNKYCKEHAVSLALKFDLMIQVSEGIKFLHDLDPPIAHRDIKPSNILITMTNGKAVAKLCDLGIAKAAERRGTVTESLHTDCGTDAYKAPELFELRRTRKGTYNRSVDIFSEGLFFIAFVEAKDNQELVPPQCKNLIISKIRMMY